MVVDQRTEGSKRRIGLIVNIVDGPIEVQAQPIAAEADAEKVIGANAGLKTYPKGADGRADKQSKWQRLRWRCDRR